MDNSRNIIDQMLANTNELVDIGKVLFGGDNKDLVPIDQSPEPKPQPKPKTNVAGVDPSKYFIAPREPDQRRVKPNEQRKTFEVNEMWEMHHEIVRRLLLGQKNREIAKALRVSEAVVSYTRNSKVVKDKLDIMRAARDADTIDIAVEIREKAPKALKMLENIIDDNGATYPMSLAAKTAENWINRAGFVAPKSIILEGMVAHFTADEIDKIKKDSIREGKAAGVVIDADVEEVG